jgi:hypothetical protein
MAVNNKTESFVSKLSFNQKAALRPQSDIVGFTFSSQKARFRGPA